MFLDFNVDVWKIKKNNLLILTGMTYNFSWKDLLLFLAVTNKTRKTLDYARIVIMMFCTCTTRILLVFKVITEREDLVVVTEGRQC